MYVLPLFLMSLYMSYLCFLLLMLILKAHKRLCYYVIFIHVPTINKALNLNLQLYRNPDTFFLYLYSYYLQTRRLSNVSGFVDIWRTDISRK